jgi:hypothetical protein
LIVFLSVRGYILRVREIDEKQSNGLWSTLRMHFKFIKKILLVVMILGVVSIQSKPAHALSPKVKVLAITAGYGAVAGTLIGLASLAFGTKSKSIFIGASLGLYAGLIYGGYLIMYPPPAPGQEPNRDDDIYPNERYSLLVSETDHEEALIAMRGDALSGPSQDSGKPSFHMPLLEVTF